MPEKKQSKLGNLQRRPYVLGDPEDLVLLDWSGDRREAIGALLRLRREQVPVSDQEIVRARKVDRP